MNLKPVNGLIRTVPKASEVLSVGDNHSIVLRTIEYEEAKPKPLDEVREDVGTLVSNQKATEELNTLADTLIGELEGGADAEALATENEAEFVASAAIERANAVTDRTLVRHLFTMPKPTEDLSASYSKFRSKVLKLSKKRQSRLKKLVRVRYRQLQSSIH